MILAAGYATRLYPLTRTQPKPLLPVAGQPMLERLLAQLEASPGLDQVYVVTNAKFAAHFQRWADRYCADHPSPAIAVVNDGSTDEANRLGAIGDLHFVLTHEAVDDDLVVVAGDNLFSQSLVGFGAYGRTRQAPVLGVYEVDDLELVKQYNALTLAADGRLTFFEEKPKQPSSHLTGIALYFYPRQALPLIDQYVAEGNNPDQPGRLIQWLYPRLAVYTWRVPGRWFDIGSHEQLAEANRIFALPSPGLSSGT
ncbi:MAG: nucleotidyltransferase family protein [Verrucomicrobia bacterium]|nr:nucleotidyltransferase family protein [Verrucomicrobiota bacterium]